LSLVQKETPSPHPPHPTPPLRFPGLIDAVVSRPGVPVAVPVDRARSLRVANDAVADVGRAQIAGKRVFARLLDDRGPDGGGVALQTVYATETMKEEGNKMSDYVEAAALNDGATPEAAARAADLAKIAYMMSGSQVVAKIAAVAALRELAAAPGALRAADVAAMKAMNAAIEKKGGKPVPLTALFKTKEEKAKRRAILEAEAEALAAARAAARAAAGLGPEGEEKGGEEGQQG
jgi:hypothetical protein